MLRIAIRQTEGSALVEFAVVLPLLVVFLVGIYDFSGAFNQKQKIGHAAQEGAVIAGAQPMMDIYATNPSPASLRPVVAVVFNSLVQNGVLPQGNQGSCILPGSATYVSGLKWQFSITGCPDTLLVTIDRGLVTGTAGQTQALTTSVTVSYKYHWRFNSVIQLLFPGAAYSPTTDLSDAATTQNQS